MATKSKVTVPSISETICQGDVFKNVRYSYINSTDNDSVDVIEFEFPLAVIISQACDVIAMHDMISNGSGKPTKFMPSILMCPIYNKQAVKTGEHLTDVFDLFNITFDKEDVYHKDDYKVAERDWHYRFHALELTLNNKTILNSAIIDFKHYFSVPISYLINNINNRVYHLDDIFSEQLTLKFATFLSRVAIP